MSSDTWIDRVRAADAEAEEAYRRANRYELDDDGHSNMVKNSAEALIAIAAELRAQRIARRPGAGQ